MTACHNMCHIPGRRVGIKVLQFLREYRILSQLIHQ